MFKRVLAVILCAIMIVGILPLGVLATDVSNHNQGSSDVSISNDTTMGRILNNTLETTASDDDGFSISYIEVEGKTATVIDLNILFADIDIQRDKNEILVRS